MGRVFQNFDDVHNFERNSGAEPPPPKNIELIFARIQNHCFSVRHRSWPWKRKKKPTTNLSQTLYTILVSGAHYLPPAWVASGRRQKVLSLAPRGHSRWCWGWQSSAPDTDRCWSSFCCSRPAIGCPLPLCCRPVSHRSADTKWVENKKGNEIKTVLL